MIVYLTGGLGNNILQIIYVKSYSSVESVKFINILQKKNIFTKFLKWNTHPEVVSELFDLNYIDKRAISVVIDLIFLFLSLQIRRDFMGYSFIRNASSIPSRKILGYAHPTNEAAFNLMMLSSKSILKKFEIPKLNHIGVHVRRGDIGDNDNLGLLLPDYFNDAIKKLLIHEHRPIIVYTNDKKWCKDNLKFNFEFEGPQLHESPVINDYLGLCSAACLVSSNSTFSYTAAMIGQAETVIVPFPFFKRELIFIPKYWISQSANYQ